MYLLRAFNKKVRGCGEILCFIYVFFVPVYVSNSCRLQNMCNRAPWGHTFRWVAEFGVIPAPCLQATIPNPGAPGHGAVCLRWLWTCGECLAPDPIDRLDCTHQGKLRNIQVQQKTYISYGLSTRVRAQKVGFLTPTSMSPDSSSHCAKV